MSTLGSVILRGITSSRPAASISGRLYFATDTGKQWRDSGSTWEEVTGSIDWGDINGALASQTDLQTALDDKLDDAQLDVDGTLAANSDTKVPSQKAVKTYVDAGLGGVASDWGDIGGTLSDQTDLQTALDAKLDDSMLDVDGTLAADSDAKIPSQKAVKTYVDGHTSPSPLTTKGDVFTHSTVDARLGVGADGEVLTADSTQATGLKWAPGGGGSSPLTTKGDLWGYSTVDARVPVGSDGQVLVADSVQTKGVKWQGGGMVLLEQHTASSSSSLDFTASISSSYDEYVVELVNLLPATNGANLLFLYSTNGGSSYDTSAIYDLTNAYSGGVAGGTFTGQTSFQFSSFCSNSSSYGGVCGSIRLMSPASAFYKVLQAHTLKFDTNISNINAYNSDGYYKSATAANAFRLLFSSGNIASGTVRVYGIAK